MQENMQQSYLHMIRRVGHQGSHFTLGQAWFVQVHRVMDDWRYVKTHPRVYF